MSEKKYFFLKSEEDNIYRSYTPCERNCFPNFFFGKQPIENKSYFYKNFLLTKDSFLLTKFFLCYQTLENVKNYFYRMFSSETNRALGSSSQRNQVCQGRVLRAKSSFLDLRC